MLFKKTFLFFLILMSFSFNSYSGDQTIVSFLDGSTVQSDNYILQNELLESEAKAISLKASNDAVTFFSNDFSLFENTAEDSDRVELSYNGSPKNVVYFPVKPNSEAEVKEVSFKLIEEKDQATDSDVEDTTIYETLIDETYYIPASTIKLKQDNSDRNIFTWDQNSLEFSHRVLYKKQEVMLRISKKESGNNKYDIYTQSNPIKNQNASANTSDFLSGKSEYLDFIFDYTSDTTPSSTADNGLDVKFANGFIELTGLPKGEYNLYLYTFRYSNTESSKGTYFVTSFEDEIAFSSSGETELHAENNFNILDINTENFPEIKVSVLTTSLDKPVSEIEKKILEAHSSDLNSKFNINDISSDSEIPDKVYLSDGQVLELDSDGSCGIGSTKYYFKKWFITYSSAFDERDGVQRNIDISLNAVFSDNSRLSLENNSSESDTYYLAPREIAKDTRFPHQTLVFYFDSLKEFNTENYSLEDAVLVPGSRGYRDMKLVEYKSGAGSSAIDKSIYSPDNFSDISKFSFNTNSLKWELNSTKLTPGLMIKKVTTDAKAGFYNTSETINLEFYSDEKIKNFTKEKEKGDNVKFSWEDGPINSNYAVTSYDKFLFRISRSDLKENVEYTIDGKTYSEELPKYYLDPYNGNNRVNQVDPNNNPGATVENFIDGTSDYIDLVFESNADSEVTTSTTMFAFSSSNELSIIGLPRGDYTLQVYSIKNGHDGNYKVFTYEECDTEFTMELPEAATGDFAKQNNFFKVDYITAQEVDIEGESYVQAKVNFITKFEREVSLTKDNLITLSSDGKTAESNLNLKKRELVDPTLGTFNVEESKKSDFQYPLDIVFLIDTSGSMQEEIDATKDGLKEFTSELTSRGYDVKFNLLTFGPMIQPIINGEWSDKIHKKLDSRSGYKYYRDHNNYKYYQEKGFHLGIYKEKWFDGSEVASNYSLDEIVDAFDEIYALGGYPAGQENSAWAMHYGINHLNDNGRYLDYSNQIVSHGNYKTGYIPSKKWIILLTDENMDKDTVNSIGGGYTSENVLEKLSEKLIDSSINLTQIMHVNKDITTPNNYDLDFKEEKSTKWVEKWVEKKVWSYRRYVTRWVKEWVEVDTTEYTVLDDRKSPVEGIDPSDKGDISHTDFKLKSLGLGNLCNIYEMGGSGQHVGPALKEAVNNIGIIQRWVLTYTSPYETFDGTTRQVDFQLKDVIGLDGIGVEVEDKNSDTDRQYKVPEEKIRIEFVDPSEGKLYLSKNSEDKWAVKAKVRSRYYQEINGENVTLEDKIKKVKITIRDSKTERLLFIKDSTKDEVTLSKDLDGWYFADTILNDEEVEVLKTAGTDNIDIELIASTATVSSTETLKEVYVDVTPPQIDSIEFTNTTLENFWGSLQSVDKNAVFSGTGDENKVSEYSHYLINNPEEVNAKGRFILPSSIQGRFAKKGDRIKLVITVSDDNLADLDNLGDRAMKIDLENFGTDSILNSSVIKVSDTQVKFEWVISVTSSSNGNVFAKFDIEDKSGNNLNELITKSQVAKLDNTPIEDPDIISYSKNGIEEEMYANENYRYFNDDYAIKYSKSNGARAHLILFRHDDSQSDNGYSNTYSDFNNINSGQTLVYYGAVKNSKNFSFPGDSTDYDGKYEIKRMIAIDKSGNISTLDGDTISYGSDDESKETIVYILKNNTNIVNDTSINSGEYFVDNVAPGNIEGRIIKVNDAEPKLDSLLGLPAALPFKGKDTVKITLTATDHNLAMTADQSIGRSGSDRLNSTADLQLLDNVNSPPLWQTDTFRVLEEENTMINNDFYTAYIADKAGNITQYSVQGTLSNIVPSPAEIELYENFSDWENEDTKITGNSSLRANDGSNTYTFSKGSVWSNAKKPRFALSFSNPGTVKYLKLNLNGREYFEPSSTTSSSISIAAIDDGLYLIPNSKNEVVTISYSESGKPSRQNTSYIVVDTGINSSSALKLTNSATYKPADKEYEFELDFSNFLELAGLKGYKVKSVQTNANGKLKTFSPTISYPDGDQNLGSDYQNHMEISTSPSTEFTGNNIKKTVSISKDDLIPGSRIELIVVLIDSLGSKGEATFSFLIPEPSVRLKAKTTGSNRVMVSDIKMVGESNANKGFEVELFNHIEE